MPSSQENKRGSITLRNNTMRGNGTFARIQGDYDIKAHGNVQDGNGTFLDHSKKPLPPSADDKWHKRPAGSIFLSVVAKIIGASLLRLFERFRHAVGI